MMMLISFSALFLSVILIQIGSGSLGPLDALAGSGLGFTTSEIGLLGSAHFLGLLIGCLVNPYIIRRAGHARAFAVMASLSAISALLHPLVPTLYAWCLMRILTGFAIAGAYTVIESWLQAKLTNSTRGRVFSFYRVSDMLGTLLAQGLIAVLDPASYVAYNIVTIICCLSLLPLALTKSVPPLLPERMPFRPHFAWQLSPLASIGVITAGLTNSSFRMVGPVYALEMGLEASRVALFLAMGVLGGVLVQYPAGMITDRFNRRSVLLAFSLASCIICLLIGGADIQPGSTYIWLIYCSAFLFGAATFPIYSICATHASDFASPEQMVDLSASIVFLYSIGAIISPIFAGLLIDQFGPWAMFSYIACIHAILSGYSIWRMGIRPAIGTSRYRYVPRTTPFIHHILRSTKRN